MNLVNFLDYIPLNSLRRKMDANLTNWKSAPIEWSHIDINEWNALLELGLEVETVKLSEEGVFEYKGKKVIVYIRDQYSFGQNKTRQYRFHLTDCRTLIEKRKKNKYLSRYVLTIRRDGKFLINVKTNNRWEKNKIEKMKLCQNCWNQLKQTNNSNLKLDDWNKFDIEDYFKKLDSKIVDLPINTEKTMPLNEYSKNQKELSNAYRADKKWICEDCNHDFSSRKEFLHLHHKNSDKSDNSYSNLSALCIECHSKQPMHSHVKNLSKYKECIKFKRSNEE